MIHEAIYSARPDVGAVVHLHAPSMLAVSCLEDGLVLLEQNGAHFDGRVAYHDWEGLSDDRAEQARLGASLGPTAHTLLLRNHGALCTGTTVGQAFVRAWMLEKVCAVQLAVLASGARARRPADAVFAHAARQIDAAFPSGRDEWPALLRYWARHTTAARL